MKARTPFWPLVRNGLELTLLGFWPVILWLAANLAIVFFYVSPKFPQGFADERGSLNRVGDGVIGCTILIYAWLWLAFSGVLSHLVNSGATRNIVEFMWTRAIDRRVAHRAGAMTGWILFLGPVILNLLLSPFASNLAVEEDFNSPALERMNGRYQAVFPGSYLQPANQTEPAQLVVSHGRVLFAAWICWVGVVCFISMDAYWGVLLKQVQRNAWRLTERWAIRKILLDFIVFAPVFVIPAIPLTYAAITRVDLYEESFLFFSDHWIPTTLLTGILLVGAQIFAEKKFSELELP